MGTGSGVLAMFAADAGAKKIYAVENDPKNILTLKKTFASNSYGGVIEIIEGDVTKVPLPERVDVIVGEMIATGLIEELQIQAMNNMLQYSKDDTKVVLNKMENYIDLVCNNDTFYNHKFPVIRYEYPELPQLKSKSFSDKYLFGLVDFSKTIKNLDVNVNSILKISNNGKINGLRISSKTIFYDNSIFDASSAYSYPIILPIEDFQVEAGDEFVVHLSYKLCSGFDKLNYKVTKK